MGFANFCASLWWHKQSEHWLFFFCLHKEFSLGVTTEALAEVLYSEGTINKFILYLDHQ